MKAKAIDPISGKESKVNLSASQVEQLADLQTEYVSDATLDRYLDKLSLSADAKALLASLRKVVVKVGGAVVRVGKRILELAIMIAQKYPNTTFGLVLGLLVSFLAQAIPILGFVLGPLIAPIAITFGLALGWLEDQKDRALDRKIREATAMFEPLRGEAS